VSLPKNNFIYITITLFLFQMTSSCRGELTVEQFVEHLNTRRADIAKSGEGKYTLFRFTISTDEYDKLRSRILESDPSWIEDELPSFLDKLKSSGTIPTLTKEKVAFYYQGSSWRVVKVTDPDISVLQDLKKTKYKNARIVDKPSKIEAAFDGKNLELLENKQRLIKLPPEQAFKYFKLEDLDFSLLPWEQVTDKSLLRPEQRLTVSTEGPNAILKLIDHKPKENGEVIVEHKFNSELGYAPVSIRMFQGESTRQEILVRLTTPKVGELAKPLLALHAINSKNGNMEIRLFLIKKWKESLTKTGALKIPTSESTEISDRRFGNNLEPQRNCSTHYRYWIIALGAILLLTSVILTVRKYRKG
jgi:hypothetical protein